MTAKAKKIVNTIVTVLIVIVTVFSALLLIFSLTLKIKGEKNLLFGVGFFQIVTGSMQPEIMINDVVVGVKVSESDLREGDNIIFVMDGKIVTHKLKRIVGDGTFVTRGVANNSDDSPITYSNIIARQAFVLPQFGVFLNFMRSNFGFLIFILAPLVLIVTYQSVNLAKKLKEYHDDGDNEKTEENSLKEAIKSAQSELQSRQENSSEKDDDIDDKNDLRPNE